MTGDKTQPKKPGEQLGATVVIGIIFAVGMFWSWTQTGKVRIDWWNGMQKPTTTIASIPYRPFITTAPVPYRPFITTTLYRSNIPTMPDRGYSKCNPNYSDCVPNVAYDLDCFDIDGSVYVTGVDVYNLDGDGDGVGCE